MSAREMTIVRMNARAAALALLLVLPACDRVIWHEGQPGERGPQGAPGQVGPVGPQGEAAASPGARLRPEILTADDGARAWLGSWRDAERGESCAFAEAEEPDLLRCLPRHRTQQELTAFASPTCDGVRASKVHEPGYIRETSSGTLFRLSAPVAEAWGQDGAGACVSLGAGSWYAWEAVPWEAFVAGDVAAD